MNALAPYDAVFFASYGGPNGPDDVLPFMRNATRGRGVPDERLLEVSEHYKLFDGISPINARNDELLAAVRVELANREIDVPVVIGNRNWHPFFTETLKELRDHGAKRVLVVITSAYASYSGCRQYREDLAGALDEIGGGLVCDKIGPFADSDGFEAANVAALRDALGQLNDAHVLFVTHSIPLAMNAVSGGSFGTYVDQHHRAIERVMSAFPDVEHELVFCSRSGPAQVPWLEPDVNDRIEELAQDGVKSIITVPIGFVSDHMEVVYDLDTEASKTAAECGIDYVRAATAGTHPSLVRSIVDAIVRRAQATRDGSSDQPGYTCPANCCLPRAGYQPLPTIA